MSGNVPPSHDPAKPGADPSMDDILASIRRILSEDEAAGTAAPAGAEPSAAAKAPDDSVLMLDSSMIVAAETPSALPPTPSAAESPAPASHVPEAHVPPPPHAPESPAMSATETTAAAPTARETALLAPESAAAAASSVDALMRTLSTERGTRVNRNGPTIEDLVREEIRPVLKAWLDIHLPPLVERLVRAEIERVSGRTAL